MKHIDNLEMNQDVLWYTAFAAGGLLPDVKMLHAIKYQKVHVNIIDPYYGDFYAMPSDVQFKNEGIVGENLAQIYTVFIFLFLFNHVFNKDLSLTLYSSGTDYIRACFAHKRLCSDVITACDYVDVFTKSPLIYEYSRLVNSCLKKGGIAFSCKDIANNDASCSWPIVVVGMKRKELDTGSSDVLSRHFKNKRLSGTAKDKEDWEVLFKHVLNEDA